MEHKEIVNPENEGGDGMESLAAIINKATLRGYTEQFQINKKGFHSVADAESPYKPEQVKIIDFYRFEGASDPQDNAILYMIETEDGKKGTLVNGYGVYADTAISDFVTLVQDIHKNVDNTGK